MVWKVRVKDLIPLPIIQMRKLRHRAEESHTQVLGASKWWLRMQVSVTLNLELATTRDPAGRAARMEERRFLGSASTAQQPVLPRRS